jgi:hypothetical protein
MKEFVMKLSALAAFALMLGAAVPAMAQDINMASITCKDFVSSTDKAAIGNIIVWLEGFYTSQDAAPILHVDKMTKDAGALATYCSANPADNIITAAEKVMPVK